MKRVICFLLLLFIVLQVSSCKKFLEEQSQTDIVPRSASSLNELLLGKGYDVAANPAIRFMDDDASHGASAVYTFRKNFYYAYTWQPASMSDAKDAGASQWINLYPCILTCNVVLDYAPKVTGTTAEIENITGQAYLLRAFYYFKLVNFYAKPYSDKLSNPNVDPGVPLILSSGLSLEGKARNTVYEVYQQITADLTKGIEQLQRSGKNNSIYRISHIAGYLLASRVYMQMGEWQKAIDAATYVLNNKPELIDLNTWGTSDPNTKAIVEAKSPECLWAFGNPQDVVYQENTESDFYTLSNDLMASFEDGDLRTIIYIKNKKNNKVPTNIYTNQTIAAQSFRTSEAVLNRAEAYAQLNKLGQTANAQLALNDLNQLRKKRFTPGTYQDLLSTSADELLKKCYDEKRREFFGEEYHRWFDLRRHGMPSITHIFHENVSQALSYVLQDHDPGYIFQIPKSALNKNSKLIPNPEPALRVGL
jgi:hypothetical protein